MTAPPPGTAFDFSTPLVSDRVAAPAWRVASLLTTAAQQLDAGKSVEDVLWAVWRESGLAAQWGQRAEHDSAAAFIDARQQERHRGLKTWSAFALRQEAGEDHPLIYAKAFRELLPGVAHSAVADDLQLRIGKLGQGFDGHIDAFPVDQSAYEEKAVG